MCDDGFIDSFIILKTAQPNIAAAIPTSVSDFLKNKKRSFGDYFLSRFLFAIFLFHY